MTGFLGRVRDLLPEYPPYYAAPAGDLLRLDQNTNRLGVHPAVVRVTPDLSAANLYPDRDNGPLIDAVAEAFDVDRERLFAANGSDEVLDILIRLLTPPGGRVATPHPSYSMYPHLCRFSRVDHIQVPYDADFRLHADDLLAADADLILIANPDNPTGTVLSSKTITRVLDAFDGPVVLDEAYADFAEETFLDRLADHDNLLVVRTLSKAYGLAGLRVGFGAAHPDVAELVRRAKLPFSINLASQQLAIEALKDPQPARDGVRVIADERGRLAAGLEDRGFDVTPSRANFLLTKPPIKPAALRDALRERGILARTFEHEPALADRIRFTVGTTEETNRLFAALDDILKEAAP